MPAYFRQLVGARLARVRRDNDDFFSLARHYAEGWIDGIFGNEALKVPNLRLVDVRCRRLAHYGSLLNI